PEVLCVHFLGVARSTAAFRRFLCVHLNKDMKGSSLSSIDQVGRTVIETLERLYFQPCSPWFCFVSHVSPLCLWPGRHARHQRRLYPATTPPSSQPYSRDCPRRPTRTWS